MSYSNLSFIATNRPLEPFHSPGMARAGPLDLAGVRCKPPESRKTFSGSNGTAYQSHSVVDYLPPDGISDRGKFFPQMESRGPRNGVIASQCRPVNLIHCVSGSRRPLSRLEACLAMRLRAVASLRYLHLVVYRAPMESLATYERTSFQRVRNHYEH